MDRATRCVVVLALGLAVCTEWQPWTSAQVATAVPADNRSESVPSQPSSSSSAFSLTSTTKSVSIVSSQASVTMSAGSTSTVVSSQYYFPDDQPVVALDAKTAFEALTQREKLYAHHLSRASYVGGLVVLLQTSPEAPEIFRLLQRITVAEDTESLRKAALAAGVTEREFKAFLVYGSGIYTNMGNYKGFGDSKIVPNLPADRFELIVKASAAAKSNDGYSEDLLSLWNSVKDDMYRLTERQKQLGLGHKGVTKYFSDNCDQADADLVTKYFKTKNLEGYMNRVLKTVSNGKTTYEIRHPAVQEKVLFTDEFDGATFNVTTGDYAPLMALVNKNLEQAKAFVANDLEKNMLDYYIQCFETGSLDAHKNGSREWIKNKKPAVETYIGFIENYRDPAGMRAEFEGFVSMVNREQSAKFQALVDHAEELLTRLPWPKEFEKDKFLLPDFTSLDVLTFSGSGVPAGINIPNYDEIRQSEGFKNVNLGNVIQASYKADKKTTFVSQADHEMLDKYRVESFEVQVGLHELLGHGSGKLLQSVNGSLNYPAGLINPLTGKPVDKHYEDGETYDSKFTSLGSSYEECRAECVGLYLCGYDDVLKIFNVKDGGDDVTYTNWLSMCHAGVKSVEMYSAGTKEWKQAHSRARFVILQVLLEAGEGFVEVKEVTGEDGQPDLLLTVDRSKIESVGKPAIGAFLQKLQVYKSTGDAETASKMFNAYSEVKPDGPHPFAKWMDIVIARKVPRKMLVQANTVLKEESLSLVSYDASHEGMAKSWSERFPAAEYKSVDNAIHQLYVKDQPYFTSKE